MISTAQRESFHELLSILSSHRILGHLILIGSWSEYIYEDAKIFDGFEANLRTKDYDFFVPNAARPSPPVKLKDILASHGWASMDDPMTEATKFLKTSGNGEVFEAEFLVGMRGKGTDSIFSVRSLSINGQSMRELNMLEESPLEVDYKGWPLRVPNPVQYVFHKILINPVRNSAEKQIKDIQSVRNLLDHMRTPEWRNRLQLGYSQLTKKQKTAIKAVSSAESIYLGIDLD